MSRARFTAVHRCHCATWVLIPIPSPPLRHPPLTPPTHRSGKGKRLEPSKFEGEMETESRKGAQANCNRLILPKTKEEIPDIFLRRLDAHRSDTRTNWTPKPKLRHSTRGPPPSAAPQLHRRSHTRSGSQRRTWLT